MQDWTVVVVVSGRVILFWGGAGQRSKAKAASTRGSILVAPLLDLCVRLARRFHYSPRLQQVLSQYRTDVEGIRKRAARCRCPVVSYGPYEVFVLIVGIMVSDFLPGGSLGVDDGDAILPIIRNLLNKRCKWAVVVASQVSSRSSHNCNLTSVLTSTSQRTSTPLAMSPCQYDRSHSCLSALALSRNTYTDQCKLTCRVQSLHHERDP